VRATIRAGSYHQRGFSPARVRPPVPLNRQDHTRELDFTIVPKSTLSAIDFIRNSPADAEPDTPGRAFLDYS